MKLPKRAGDSPLMVEVKAGKKYYWCSCGLSGKQPFCDGSHKGTEFSPLEYEAGESGEKWFCSCKQSQNKPFCDGSHSNN